LTGHSEWKTTRIEIKNGMEENENGNKNENRIEIRMEEEIVF